MSMRIGPLEEICFYADHVEYEVKGVSRSVLPTWGTASDRVLQAREHNRERWCELTEQEQNIVALHMKHELLRLAECVDTWLPEQITEHATRINVTLEIDMDSSRVGAIRRQEEQRVQEKANRTAMKLARIVQELRGE